MTTLAANVNRNFEHAEQDQNDLPVIASDIIYAGAAVGDNASGLARPLVGGDPFLGFAARKADNSAGLASDIDVSLIGKGVVELPVTGASSAAANKELVYAADDNDFTLNASGATLIGRVKRWVSGTTCMVSFRALWNEDGDVT